MLCSLSGYAAPDLFLAQSCWKQWMKYCGEADIDRNCRLWTEVVFCRRKLHCEPWTEVVSHATPPHLVKVKINFDKAQKLTWKEVKFLYGTKENYKREYKREVSQSCSLHVLLQSAMFCKYSLKIKGSTKNRLCYARYEKPLKNHSLEVAKNYVETYSSSNVAAPYPEERVTKINLVTLLNHTEN